MATTNKEIRRGTGLLVIEVRDSNPNGDPDQESDPRTRSHDRRGMISPVSFKRKLRNLLDEKEGPVFGSLGLNGREDEFRILESRGRDRKAILAELEKGTFKSKYWDARVFGNTFLEGEGGSAIAGGPVQFGVGVSVAPVIITRSTNTNFAGVQEGKSRGMAPLAFRVVVHGVYTMSFMTNATATLKTGCTAEDIAVLLRLIPYAYAHSASASRPSVEIRHAWYAEHKSALGSCSDFAIIDALTPSRLGDSEQPSSSWDDYIVPGRLGDLESRLASFQDLMVSDS